MDKMSIYFILVVSLLFSLPAYCYSEYRFISIDYPDSYSTSAMSINNCGQIAGWFYSDDNDRMYGFLYEKGEFVLISYPGSSATNAFYINDTGQVVGTYTANLGFIYEKGNYTPIEYPGSGSTVPLAINDHGKIVGHWKRQNVWGDIFDGFLYEDDIFESINYPKTNQTCPEAINNSDEIVGWFLDLENLYHAFYYNEGSFTVIGDTGARFVGINNSGQIVGYINDSNGFLYENDDFVLIAYPGAKVTRPSSINDMGQVVGSWSEVTVNPEWRGFLYDDGTLTGLDHPNAVATEPYSINDMGQVVGRWWDNNNRYHGFLYGDFSLPTVSTRGVAEVMSDGASGGGNVTADGGLYVTTRGLCWSTSSSPTTSSRHTSDGKGTGSFTSSLTGLSPNTKYYVRAYATNRLGTGYGSDVSVTTDYETTLYVSPPLHTEPTYGGS